MDRCVDLQGMNLNQGSQALFYQGILKFKTSMHSRQQTTINLAIARHAVHEINGETPTDPQIWKSIRNKDFPKSIQGFSRQSFTMLLRLATSGLKCQNMNKEPTAVYVE